MVAGCVDEVSEVDVSVVSCVVGSPGFLVSAETTSADGGPAAVPVSRDPIENN